MQILHRLVGVLQRQPATGLLPEITTNAKQRRHRDEKKII